MKTVFAWVIEKGSSPQHEPRYWGGPNRQWTSDPFKAVRFSREKDAEMVAVAVLPEWTVFRTVEHGFDEE